MRAPKSPDRTHLALQVLEDRTVPTTATLTGNGVLSVLGTYNADTIQITQSGGMLNVSGTGQQFNAASVNTIVVDGNEGDDLITVDAGFGGTTWLYGGGGNDTIRGGSGVNHIYGSGGNDNITGGSAGDVIYGGTGSNTLNAPAGASVTNGSPNMTATQTAAAQQVIDLVNQYRAQNGLAPVVFNAKLAAEAQLMANDMVSMVPVVGYSAAMSHTLNGVAHPTMTARANAVGYDYLALGENIAFGYPDAASVMNAWMNSAGHRANILNASFTQMGASLAFTPDGMAYWAQEFGTPSSITEPDPTPPSGGGVAPPTGGTTPPSAAPPTNGFGGGAALAGHIYAVGSDAGNPSTVTVYDAASGTVKFYFAPYDANFRGGVRVATGDVNGDGKDDFIVAPGAGMSPLVKIYDGVTGNEIRNFNAYSPAFSGGVNVAAGDVNGDGKADIITGADAGGGPHVQVFDGAMGNVIRGFFAYNPAFSGGVRVAAGDVNGDGKADIITGAGPSGGPHVEVFDAVTNRVLRSFFAYASTFTGGVNVSAGDLNGDGKADIITGAGADGGPHVRAFSGADMTQLASFFASTPSFTGGIRVKAMDLNGDGKAEIVTGTGIGNHECRLYSNIGSLMSSFLAGDPGNMGGVFVG